jgi:hypothetical protein
MYQKSSRDMVLKPEAATPPASDAFGPIKGESDIQESYNTIITPQSL